MAACSRRRSFLEKIQCCDDLSELVKNVKSGLIQLYPIVSKHDIDLIKVIGSGCFSNIYLANLKTGKGDKKIVLKSPTNCTKDSTIIEDVRLECTIMYALNHPNIIRSYGIYVIHDNLGVNYCISMDLMDGNLRDLIIKYNQLSRMSSIQKDVILNSISKQIANAMNYLHLNKIIHCDLKLANILYNSSYVVKICDFGLSTLNCPGEKKRVGTPLYMAPEVIRSLNQGRCAFNEKIDVYSYGILLWEIYTQKEAFLGYNDENAFIQKVIRDRELYNVNPLEFEQSFSLDLKNLLHRSWKMNPADRPSFEQILQSPMFLTKS